MTNISTENLPEDFLERLQLLIPKEKLEAVLASFCTEKPVSFRINKLKTTTEVVKEELHQLKLDYEQIPWYPDAFILANGQGRTLSESPVFKAGLIYLQGLSSMIPALVLDHKPSEFVLDIAAAPGSKTSQMAMLMTNRGIIIANDISRDRLFKMKTILENQGVTNTELVNYPGQSLWRKYPDYFDKTLVDVPCTMEGRFLCTDRQSFEGWSVRKVKLLQEEQAHLLWSAISATKPGGTIVYSTCTLSPEENEGVIDWILKKQPGIVVEKIDLDIPDKTEPITRWLGKDYNPLVKNTLRILPTITMEGFFVAKIRKNENM